MSNHAPRLFDALKRLAAAASLLLVLTPGLTGCDANGPAFNDTPALIQASPSVAPAQDNRTAKSRYPGTRGDGEPGPGAQTDRHPQ